jgi:dihydrodipicolinate synthase/N-acetylneuraminate lyase
MLKGILPPLVTPFREDGALDLRAFEANLERYAEQDLGGYLVLGSNGEAASLDEPEKLALIAATRKRAGRRTVLAGTGLESTAATIALTRKAADQGADAALVLTPHYYKAQMRADALKRHFEAVADASPIPVLLYSVPAFTGLVLPAELPAAVSGHPRIAGMKESSGDMGLMGRVLQSVPPSFTVACGSAPVIYPALCLGAAAGILAVACCAPAPTAALFRAFEAGDHALARRLQQALTPLATAVTATYGVPGLKLALDLAGYTGGSPRPPLMPAPPAAREELTALLARAQEAVAKPEPARSK